MLLNYQDLYHPYHLSFFVNLPKISVFLSFFVCQGHKNHFLVHILYHNYPYYVLLHAYLTVFLLQTVIYVHIRLFYRKNAPKQTYYPVFVLQNRVLACKLAHFHDIFLVCMKITLLDSFYRQKVFDLQHELAFLEHYIEFLFDLRGHQRLKLSFLP